jgi:hypothetical protein
VVSSGEAATHGVGLVRPDVEPALVDRFPAARTRPVRWSALLAAIAMVSIALALIPDRTQIAPLVESDYCYLLMAADRLYEGHGLTAPPPVAPHQPWTWQADWAHLTKWPVGYPVLVCAIRWLFGLGTIQACRAIAVVACAAALVGWFAWVRRVVPRGIAGVLLAAVAAGCAVSTAALLNPSTDTLLMAALPYVLLMGAHALEPLRSDSKVSRPRVTGWLAVAGLAAGGLVWIRYAAVFLPIAIAAYLLMACRLRREVRLRQVVIFGLCAALPVLAILAVNRALGVGESTQAQLNLGTSIGFDLSPAMAAEAWWRATDLGFYDYHWWSRWVFALWPVLVLGVSMVVPSARRAMRAFAGHAAVCLSGLVLICLLGTLIGATALFGDKFDFAGLDRYYLPAKPLYFVLFAAPVLLIPRRVVRALACVAMVVACSWVVEQEWHRPYRRWLNADRPATPYGLWAACFGPNAGDLYPWLADQADPGLIVVSNFHEYIALETKIPALPIPPDAATLDSWIERICASRGVAGARVLFVLAPDNKWRDYWIADPKTIVRDFGLTRRDDSPIHMPEHVFEYPSPASAALTAAG